MSGMSYPGARSRLAGPVPVDDVLDLPLDPATGFLAFSAGGVPIPTATPPTTILYSSAAAEAVSIIPAAPDPASLTAIYARLLSTAAASRWIQIFQGVAAPIAGATPFLVGDKATPAGGNTQWVPPDGVARDLGYVVALSSTQDTYTAVGANEMLVRAMGR